MAIACETAVQIAQRDRVAESLERVCRLAVRAVPSSSSIGPPWREEVRRRDGLLDVEIPK